MAPADRLVEILPGILCWAAFSPAHRVELSSTAVRTSGGWWIFDPIPLAETAGELFTSASVAGIILTNENHERDAPAWSTRLQTALWAAPDADLALPNLRRWPTNSSRWEDWHLIPLPGGPRGETAFVLPERSLAVFGDAVVNLSDRSLEILPEKYCEDPQRLRESLRHLPVFAQALFAHGDPLIGQASDQIAALLTGCDT